MTLNTFFANTLSNEGFVKTETFAQSLALSVLSGIPVLFHGKGGYGKTEKVISCMKAIQGCRFGMLECDPEVTSSHLKGGAIAKTTKTQDAEITEAYYKVGASLLKYDAFFLEEMLDASFNALSMLKAVITNKKLHVNGDEVISNNKILIGATNLNPIEFRASLPELQANSYDALLQRFLVVEDGWSSHTKSDYSLLDQQVHQGDVSPVSLKDIVTMRELVKTDIPVASSLSRTLQHLAEKSAGNGFVVSPRAYKWTKELLRCSAFLREASIADEADLGVLQFLSYWDVSLLDGLEEEIKRQKEIEAQAHKLEAFISRIDTGFNKLTTRSSLKDISLIWKSAKALELEIANSGRYNDDLHKRYESIKSKVAKLISEAEKKRDEVINETENSVLF